MDNKEILIGVSILLLAIFFFSGLFRTTGFAVNDQKLLVSLDIPPEQQRIEPGQSLLLEIALRVPGGNIDQTSIVELEYSIKDLDGKIISSKKESGAIAVKESTVASLLVPTVTKPGVYNAVVGVTYQGDFYEGSKTFEVTGKKSTLEIIVYILAGLLLLIFISLIVRKIRNRYSY